MTTQIGQITSEKLVSIITPCYNGERYIARFIQSIVDQTYPNIELIIVDDGSTDKTKDIIMSFSNKFEEDKRSLKYLYQENAGQSSAINKALSIFSGDYLTWPDSDDALTPDAIEKKVRFLERYPHYGTVVCKTEIVADNTYQKIGLQERIKSEADDNIFFDLITGTNVYYSPGGYMVRSSMFRKCMPHPLRIESPREIGQNYQLLLPITYNYPTGYIDDVCYLYTLRASSHSRTKHSFEEDERIIEISQQVLKNIISSITLHEGDIRKCEKALAIQKSRNLLRIMIQHKRQDFIPDIEALIKEFNIMEHDIRIGMKLTKHPILKPFYKLYSKVRKII